MTTLTQVEPTAATAPAPVSSMESAAVNPVRRGPIVLALHGSTSSPAAISSAQLIAARLGLSVEGVSVTPAEPGYASPMDIMADPHRSPFLTDTEHEREIHGALRQALLTDPGWRISVRHGPPAREVARAAQALDATMIIVNATSTAGLLRTMAGIFATEVARRSTCPVLAVTAPLAAPPRSIVAAVDFSPASIRAVQAAVLVADERAVLTLLHVPVPVTLAHARMKSSGAPIAGDATSLFNRLEAEIRPYAPESLTVQHMVADGSPSSAILERAQMQSADMIVAGTHGPNRLERLFVGSTAVSLLHLAPCATIIAPAPPPAERVRLQLGMSDTTVLDDPKDWAEVLALVATRNRGRFVNLQVSGVLTAHADHFILRDLAYDPVDRCVEIRMADTADGRCGLTRTIGHPGSIIVSRTPDGRDRALEVLQERGSTQLLILDDLTH